MDLASNNVLRFLRELQGARDALIAPLWNELNARGANPSPPFLTLSALGLHANKPETETEYLGSISMGIRATPEGRNAVEFEVDILWDSEKWTICTEVWVDSDNNQELLSSFGERYAMTLDECLTQLRAATSDLSTAVNKL